LSLEEARRVRKAFGTTLNDVVMALCAGALRRYLEERGELPDPPLIASVPVSVRSEKEKATYSNRVTAVMAELATDEPDPVKRLGRIHASMRSAKQMQEAIPATLLQDFTQFATPALFAQAARIPARLRIADRMRPPFNLVISNVPGPREPLYCGGAQMRTYYPVSAVAEGQGLNITVQSYLDQLDFGVITCRELVSDPWKIARYLGEALEGPARLAGRAAQCRSEMAAVPAGPLARPLAFFAPEGPRASAEWLAYFPAARLLERARRGDGHPVLVLPGFMASDDSTGILRRYL